MPVSLHKMTPAQALQVLIELPLRFGDPEQIDAVTVLRCAEQLLSRPFSCRDCDGTGIIEPEEPPVCEQCGRPCPHCARTAGSQETCELCQGTGWVAWSRDAVYGMTARAIYSALGHDQNEIIAA